MPNNEPPQFNRPAVREFDDLPQGVRDWLGSNDVGVVIVELNKRNKVDGGGLVVIPRLITRLLVGMLDAQDLNQALTYYLPDLGPQQIADIALTVKTRILKPVASSLKGLYGIDIERIAIKPLPVGPTVRTMKLEAQPKPAAAAPPKPTGTPVQTASAAPKARVMQMANVVDLRKPAPVQPAAAPRPVPVPKAPAARTTQMKPSAPAPKPQPVAPISTVPPKQKDSSEEAEVIEAAKPFGLAETVPLPPKPVPPVAPAQPLPAPAPAPAEHELVTYQDEHPMNTADQS
jgi:hypothetical protein